MTASTQKPEGPGDDASGGNQRDLLILGTDLTLAKAIQSKFQNLKEIDGNIRVFPAGDLEKAAEQIKTRHLHSIIVDEDVLGEQSRAEILKSLRDLANQNPQNKDVPILLAVAQTNIQETKEALSMGWMDVLLKPLDGSLFLQKMNLYNPSQAFLKEDLLFTMEIAKEVELAFQYQMKSISEYAMTIEANRPLDPKQVVTISGIFLPVPIVACVRECKKISDDAHSIHLMFVGVTPAETQAIRKLIRNEYAEEKQAA